MDVLPLNSQGDLTCVYSPLRNGSLIFTCIMHFYSLWLDYDLFLIYSLQARGIRRPSSWPIRFRHPHVIEVNAILEAMRVVLGERNFCWLAVAVLVQKSEIGVGSEVLNLKYSLASLNLSISLDFIDTVWVIHIQPLIQIYSDENYGLYHYFPSWENLREELNYMLRISGLVI
jgi:hypothetical protein